MQLADTIFDGTREKLADFKEMVSVFKDAFPQEVLDSGDWGEAQLINVLPAIKALQDYAEKWNMGTDHMHVSALKLVYRELTNTTFEVSHSKAHEDKVNGFADHVNDLRLLHENPIPKKGKDLDVERPAPGQS